MSTSTENITFMVIRGIVALAIVGLGFYCIAQGIHFFVLPRAEAEQIHIHFVGLDITATGLGAVIFGTGIGLCFVGKQTAPKLIKTEKDSSLVQQNSSQVPAAAITAKTPIAEPAPKKEDATITVPPSTAKTISVTSSEVVTIMEGPKTPTSHFG